MRALLPSMSGELDEPTALHEQYARDWVDSAGVRANMVASVDGAVTVGGKSAGLQTPGDNRVFAALRDLADVVLVGASTVIDEGYRPAHPSAARRALREQFGFGPELPIALVSRSLSFEPSAPIFADPWARPLLITSDAVDATPFADVADVLVCGSSAIDFGEVRRELAARGLTRVLCEGGPRLLARLVAAGEVDELCLSVTPMLAGPGAGRILGGEPLAAAAGLSLHTLLEEDGALFARYFVRR